ncbi:MAG: thiolase family protein [Thermodesulfobacteriota bacterium]
MREVAVVGVGMTKFGKYLDKGIKDLVRECVEEALGDAGAAGKGEIEAAYVGNCLAGLMTGQEAIRGQVALSAVGIDTIPIYNVESACASSSSAFNLAWTAVAAGIHDCVLVVGVEKLYHRDKSKSFQALGTAVDLEKYLEYFRMAEERIGGGKIFGAGAGEKRSIFMDMYAFLAQGYMRKYGLTQEHFGKLSVKAHRNGAMNPHAQYQKEVTLEEVLHSGDVVYPLTRMMCAPIGDGAAAAVLCAKPQAARYTTKPVWVAASVVGSGKIVFDTGDSVTRRIAPKAYEMAGIGPGEVDVIEVHDASTPSEIIFLIELGIVPAGEAAKWIDEGRLEVGGKKPSNPSGGLTCKGHPVGATGCGMIYEVVKQLRGEAGKRQVAGPPRVGMTHNGGGILGIDAASMTLHVFKR